MRLQRARHANLRADGSGYGACACRAAGSGGDSTGGNTGTGASAGEFAGEGGAPASTVTHCRTIADCATAQGSQICSDGVCSPCTQASQCAQGLVCEAGYCTGCTTDAECGDSKCHLGLCGGCGQDTDCAAGSICTNGSCSPGCATKSDCLKEYLCTAGHCVLGCEIQPDCYSYQYCHAGKCQDTCGANSECTGLGVVCRGGKCTYCTRDTDCDPGKICSVPPGGAGSDAYCKAPDCTTDANCTTYEVCSSGHCIASPCQPTSCNGCIYAGDEVCCSSCTTKYNCGQTCSF